MSPSFYGQQTWLRGDTGASKENVYRGQMLRARRSVAHGTPRFGAVSFNWPHEVDLLLGRFPARGQQGMERRQQRDGSPSPRVTGFKFSCAGNKLTGRDGVARGQIGPCRGGLSPSPTPTPTPVPKSGRCFRDGDSGRGGVGEWGRGGPAPPRPLRATAPPAGPTALRSALRALGQMSFFCHFPTSSPGQSRL